MFPPEYLGNSMMYDFLRQQKLHETAIYLGQLIWCSWTMGTHTWSYNKFEVRGVWFVLSVK